MDAIIRLELGVLLRGAIMFLAYLLVTTFVWDRDDFRGLLIAVPFMMLSGFIDRRTARGEPDHQPFREWVRTVVVHSAGLAAALAALIAILGARFDRQTLESTDQRVTLAVLSAMSIFALVYVSLPARVKVEPTPAVDRDARKAAVRERIRREIEELERQAAAEVVIYPDETVVVVVEVDDEGPVRHAPPEPDSQVGDEATEEVVPETWETSDWAAVLAKMSASDLAA